MLEIGCEELPASFIDSALEQLRSEFQSKFSGSGISFGEIKTFGTPRRLIVHVSDLPAQQQDQTVRQRGPSLKASYDDQGQPTKALLGFCQGQGAELQSVERDGDYVWVTKHIKGKTTEQYLQIIAPEIIEKLTFKKSMRWANSKLRFARPIRWIVSLFDSKVVPFEIEGIASGSSSKGHRFHAPEPFEVGNLDEFLAELQSRFVEPCHKNRVQRIETSMKSLGIEVDATDELITENANLTEWPLVHQGTFREEFLKLPESVLVTVMAKHERFFPVRVSGVLTNLFVAVRNGGDQETVSKGNSWVLNARFNDARFFYEEDRKHTLSHYLEKTDGMMFQEKLGTIRQRCDRLQNLSGQIAVWSGAGSDEQELARMAGLYSKSDLSSGLVSELDELQGVIAGDYARTEGFPEDVCYALSNQYDPSGISHCNSSQGRTALRLVMADHIDKLTGFVGLGFLPSGSSDPFALRRSATILIEAAWAWQGKLGSFDQVFQEAIDEYQKQGIELTNQDLMPNIKDIFETRYHALIESETDVLEASIGDGRDILDPRKIAFRSSVMTQLWGDEVFRQTASRPFNIVSAAQKKGIEFSGASDDPKNLDSKEGEELCKALSIQSPHAHKCALAEDGLGLIAALRPLIPPINAFFESTMVMVEDEKTRNSRLKLLENCTQTLGLAGRFS